VGVHDKPALTNQIKAAAIHLVLGPNHDFKVNHCTYHVQVKKIKYFKIPATIEKSLKLFRDKIKKMDQIDLTIDLKKVLHKSSPR